MSVKATDRAWDSGASGNDLLVMLALADFAGDAEDPYGSAFPAVPTIAAKTRVSPRTVQRCLRSLEAAGHIRKTGEHVWGRGKTTTIYRIEDASRSVKETGRQFDGGDKTPPVGVTPVTPNPPEAVKGGENAGEKKSAEGDPRDLIPDGFPDELRPHARHVMRILREVAADHGAKKVWPQALGRLMMSQPRKPFVATAHELHQWAVDPPRKIVDVVATYRTFLKRASDLEATERLADDGTPGARAGGKLPTNVRPLRPGRSAEDEAASARRAEALRRMTGTGG